MTFRDALEQEIKTQGISVTEIARISDVSKGAIYNIINGTTEEARIRPATRRAIARGCNRDLKILGDGGVLFVERGLTDDTKAVTDVRMRVIPDRPFLGDHYIKPPFDWLHKMEDEGELSGVGTVDSVFQKKEEFLSLIVENDRLIPITDLAFELQVAFDEGGPAAVFSCRTTSPIPAGESLEETLFLLAGPPYQLELRNLTCTDAEGQISTVSAPISYRFQG